jgi:hypothetical protein
LYLLQPAGWSPYFPFFTVIDPPSKPPGHMGFENPYGVLPNMPFLAVAVLGGWAVWRWWVPERRALRWFATGAAAYVVLVLGVVMGFGGITNRYMVDFVPTWSLLAAVGALAISATAAASGRVVRAVWGVAGGGLVVFGLAFNVLVSMQHNRLLAVNHPAVYEAVASRFNAVSDAVIRLTGREFGLVELEVIFPEEPASDIEPLVTTGRDFLSDYVFVHYLRPGLARVGFEHTSYGGFVGDPFEIRSGEVQRVKVEVGSLYPPPAHPYWRRVGEERAVYWQRTVRVTVDGKVVLWEEAETYDAVAWAPDVGTTKTRPAFKVPFSGVIVAVRTSDSPPDVGPPRGAGPVRMALKLPEWTGVRAEPLVTTGAAGAGNVVYVIYESADTVRFGYDHWGAGGPESEPVAVPANRRVEVEIDMASLYGREVAEDWAGAKEREGVVVKVNGLTVLTGGVRAHPARADQVMVGANRIGASTAGPAFTGEILEQSRSEDALSP